MPSPDSPGLYGIITDISRKMSYASYVSNNRSEYHAISSENIQILSNFSPGSIRNILYFCESYLIFWFWFTCGHCKILLDPPVHTWPYRLYCGRRRTNWRGHMYRLIWSKSFWVHDLIILGTRPSSSHLAWLGRI